MPRSRPRSAVALDGYVVVDKPAGMTSHDVVFRARRLLAQPKAGHAGTLDPDATGVLVLGLGRATRLMRFATGLAKRYVGEIVLGTATATLDASGEVTATYDMTGVTEEEVRAAAASLTGRILQVPPMVSAVKVGGRRLHEIARAGGEVEREPRPVEVTRFDVEPAGVPGVYRADVECSSGTYVRVLAADLGERLGGGAHLRALRRTAVGPFQVEDAVALDELARADVRPSAGLVGHLAQVVVGDELGASIAVGRVLDHRTLGVSGDGPWAVLDAAGDLLAVYEPRGEDRAKPVVVLAEASPGRSAPETARPPRLASAPVDRVDSAHASARPGVAVAIGNFDGVHVGHRALVARAITEAQRAGGRSVVLTFDRHPATVVRPKSAPRLLTSAERKLELLRATGVEHVSVLRFDAMRAHEPAEDFVRTVLVGELGVRTVVVGESFHFGHRQGGDVALLEAMGGELGFSVVRVALVGDDHSSDERVVSSSLVRMLVALGRLEEAAELLARPHEVDAVTLGVTQGDAVTLGVTQGDAVTLGVTQGDAVTLGPASGGRAPGVSASGGPAGRLALEVAPELLVPPPGVYSGLVAFDPDDRARGRWRRAEVAVLPGPGSADVGSGIPEPAPVLRVEVTAPVLLDVALTADGPGFPGGAPVPGARVTVAFVAAAGVLGVPHDGAVANAPLN